MSHHDTHMQRALTLARHAWGQTHPNPMVGALITEGDSVVAEGWHAKAGGPHAEVVALSAYHGQPTDSTTLYVTLEPCSTHGRTGPCTEAIKRSGIRNVVIGTMDPNPQHQGNGVSILRDAGINVVTDVCEADCRDLNLIFNHAMQTGGPLLAGKIATTLDGRIATRTGDAKWITGPEARADVHRWRALFPAIATGSATVLADNPALTVREPSSGNTLSCPKRLIFDRRARLLERHKQGQLFACLSDANAAQSILVTSESADISHAQQTGLNVWQLPTHDDAVFFNAFRKQCQSTGITGVFIEGGSELLSALFAARQLDYLFAYRAPKLLGDDAAIPALRGHNLSAMADAVTLTEPKHATFGNDQLLRGHLSHPTPE